MCYIIFMCSFFSTFLYLTLTNPSQLMLLQWLAFGFIWTGRPIVITPSCRFPFLILLSFTMSECGGFVMFWFIFRHNEIGSSKSVFRMYCGMGCCVKVISRVTSKSLKKTELKLKIFHKKWNVVDQLAEIIYFISE